MVNLKDLYDGGGEVGEIIERKQRKNRLLFTIIALLVVGLVFFLVGSQVEDQQTVDRLTTLSKRGSF